MKRNRFSSRKRISADATELSRLAIGLAESGSKLEDLFWQNRLAELVDQLFHDGAEDDFTGSLDRLFDAHPMAHDDLADIIESQAESCVMTRSRPGFRHPADCRAGTRLVALFDPGHGDPEGHPADAEGPSRRARVRRRVPAWRSPTICTARINCRTVLSRPGNCCNNSEKRRWPAAISASTRPAMPETNRFLSDTRYVVGALAIAARLPHFSLERGRQEHP
jgi:hypothetical protein